MKPPQLRLQLTGQPAWHDPSGRTGLLSRKDAGLLALLAWEGAVPRERALALLWQDTPPDKAHASLRQRLFRLRRDTGHDLVQSSASLSLAPGVVHDLSEPGPEAQPLLAGLDFGDMQALDEWVQGARAQWDARRVDQLTADAAQAEAGGAWARAIACTQRVLALAPLQEHAWRRLMRLHYLRGDRAAAIVAFEQFEQALAAEIGGRPSAETIEQLRQIESAAPPSAPSRRVLPPCLVRPPRTVGRAGPLAAMGRAWDAGQAFLLIGAAGLGKSRLLDEFLSTWAGGNPASLLRAQGRPGDERGPYALLMRLLRGAEPWLDPASLAEPDRRELARLLPDWGTPPAAPAQQASLWFAVEQALVAAHARGLQALVVDDLQFADAATQDLLRWLLASTPLRGLRLGLATRPLAAAVGDAWWRDSARPEPITLQPLAAADVGELIASLGLPELDLALAEPLWRHAGGEPFHLLETLKDLVLRGPMADGLPRPATVAALIGQRLADLSPAATDLLQVAAVGGADLTSARAAQLLGCSPLRLGPPWAELEAQGILQDERFCHDLMRDAALQHLPQAVRKLLHAQWAELLASDPRVPAGHLAEHWAAAERWAEAGEACFRAGLAAHQTGRLDDNSRLMLRAADWFERAGLPQRRIDALCQRLDAELVRVGGAVVVAQALDLLEQDVTPLQRAELLQVACEAWLTLADHESAHARLPELLSACAPWPALYPDALCLQGRTLTAMHRLSEALPVLQQAVSLAEQWAAQGGTEVALARALSHHAHACYISGDRMPEALAVQRRAADLALRSGDPSEHTIHSGNLATLLQIHGEAEAALTQAELTRQSYRRLHASEGHSAAINDLTLGICAWHQGQAGHALEVLNAACRRLSTEGAPPAAVLKAQVIMSGMWGLLGQRDQALAALDAPVSLQAQAPAMFRAMWHFARAIALPDQAVETQANARALALACSAEVPDLALGLGLLRYWTDAVPADAALAALPAAEAAARASDAQGVLRSLRLLRLRALRRAGQTEEAHALACDALGDSGLSLHTATHPLQAWRWLAEVFEANGDTSRAGACHQAARRWAEGASQSLPDAMVAPFLATLASG